jgi:hypothetical protein
MSYKGEVKPLRLLSPRPTLIVDQWGNRLADARSNVIGIPGPLGGERMVFALPTNTTGGVLSLRYHPPHPDGEECVFGMNFDNVIPPGVGIVRGKLEIDTNTVPPFASTDWEQGKVTVVNRTLYATLSGGVDGTDYILNWTATDTDGNIWPRSALCLTVQRSS